MKYIFFTFLLVLVLSGCNSKDPAVTGHPEDSSSTGMPVSDTISSNAESISLNAGQLASAGIQVAQAVREDISGTITLQGTIEVPPSHHVNLSFPLGGYIKATKMLPGQQVKKGEILAIVEDMQFIQLQQDYLTAKTGRELATKEFARQQVLNASKASSDKVLQETKANMERQEILLRSFAEKLKMIGINAMGLSAANITSSVALRSPVTGFVSKVNITTGKYISPTDVLFELMDISDMHLSLTVFEKDIMKIKKGARIWAYNNNDPNKRFAGAVTLVKRSFDANRSTEIHCDFDDAEPSMIPGMFMNAEVAVRNLKALVVPEEAVVRWNNRHYVFVEHGEGNFSMEEVQPGVLFEGKQQIENKKITDTTKLVVKNAFALLMKFKNVEDEG